MKKTIKVNMNGKNEFVEKVRRELIREGKKRRETKQLFNFVIFWALVIVLFTVIWNRPLAQTNALEVQKDSEFMQQLEVVTEKSDNNELEEEDIDVLVELLQEEVKEEYEEYVEEIIEPARIKPTKMDKNIQIRKDNFFMCKEVNDIYNLQSDIYKCSSYMSMTQLLETANCVTGSAEHKNCYWIKNPTDKTWLLGNEEIIDNHIAFETFEQSKYAFAYYYMKYHDHRTHENFVDRYVGWDNQRYKTFLEDNYQFVYDEYKKTF